MTTYTEETLNSFTLDDELEFESLRSDYLSEIDEIRYKYFVAFNNIIERSRLKKERISD